MVENRPLDTIIIRHEVVISTVSAPLAQNLPLEVVRSKQIDFFYKRSLRRGGGFDSFGGPSNEGVAASSLLHGSRSDELVSHAQSLDVNHFDKPKRRLIIYGPLPPSPGPGELQPIKPASLTIDTESKPTYLIFSPHFSTSGPLSKSALSPAHFHSTSLSVLEYLFDLHPSFLIQPSINPETDSHQLPPSTLPFCPALSQFPSNSDTLIPTERKSMRPSNIVLRLGINASITKRKLLRSLFAGSNSRSVKKVLEFSLVNGSLCSSVEKIWIESVKRSLDMFRVFVESVGLSGRLAMLWKRFLDVTLMSLSKNHIDILVSSTDRDADVGRRTGFWELLRSLHQRSLVPWLCFGDFNAIHFPHERKSATQFPPWQIRDFVRR
ncbi:UNVERIFIED_CONTAM: hypothetical protein Sradi_0459600 [Sesamum radiatum]|uniref:Uncharacterized protein n=1 Tax=Sesamum radiatum TaxID=300843 RepID=A0AAW2W6N4_SESRA